MKTEENVQVVGGESGRKGLSFLVWDSSGCLVILMAGEASALAEKALEWLLLFLSLLQYLSDFPVSLLSEQKPCPLLSLRESPGGVLSAPWAGVSQQSQP